MRGIRQGLLDERSQLSGSGQFVAIPENRVEPCGHFTVVTFRPYKVLGYTKGFELFSQPSCSFLVLVRVSDERAVFVCLNIAQFRFHLYRYKGLLASLPNPFQ